MLCDDTNLGHLGEATQLVGNSLLHEEKVGVAQRPMPRRLKEDFLLGVNHTLQTYRMTYALTLARSKVTLPHYLNPPILKYLRMKRPELINHPITLCWNTCIVFCND